MGYELISEKRNSLFVRYKPFFIFFIEVKMTDIDMSNFPLPCSFYVHLGSTYNKSHKIWFQSTCSHSS